MAELESVESPEKKRLILEISSGVWEDLVRESGDATIAEGKIVSVSEVARRRLEAAAA